jgi:hypothetical protein
MKSLEDIRQAAVNGYRAALVSDEDERTPHLRDVAEAYIDAREHFYTKDGEPDWAGRSYAYRQWIRETVTLAHLPHDGKQSIQAAVRYHLGNILRDRLDADTLESIGLRKDSPRERSVEKRAGVNALLRLVSGGAPLDNLNDVLDAAKAIHSALTRITPSDLPDSDAADAKAALADIAAEALKRMAM